MTEYPSKYFDKPQDAMTAGFLSALIMRTVETHLGGHAALVMDGDDYTPFIDIHLPEDAQAFGHPATVRIHILAGEVPQEPLYPPAGRAG